jgi:multidrug efflux pump
MTPSWWSRTWRDIFAQGMSRRDAALASSRRLLSPIIAMTITLGSGVRPHRFPVRFVWRAFREFAFTLAVAVLISGLVAMTLSPIMSAWVCPDSGHETRMSALGKQRFEQHRETLRRTDGGFFAALAVAAVNSRGVLYATDCATVSVFSEGTLAPIEDQQRHQSGGGCGSRVFGGRNVAAASLDAVDVLMERPETTYIWQAFPGLRAATAVTNLFRPMSAT